MAECIMILFQTKRDIFYIKNDIEIYRRFGNILNQYFQMKEVLFFCYFALTYTVTSTDKFGNGGDWHDKSDRVMLTISTRLLQCANGLFETC